MTSIYRFDKLNHFEQIVRDKALTFVSPYCWPDKHEGFLFREVFSDSEMEKVRTAAEEMFRNTSFHKETGNSIVALLTALRTTRLAQCWSKCGGNFTLWDNKDVRIEVHREDISHLSRVEARDVEYLESITIEDGLRRLKLEPVAGGQTHIDIDSALLVKHTFFLPEHEVRLIIEEAENVNRDRRENIVFTHIFTQFYRQGKMNKEDYEKEILRLRLVDKKKVSFAHVENFIKSVMLHPCASAETEMKVERLCKEYHLKYLGRWQPQDIESLLPWA